MTGSPTVFELVEWFDCLLGLRPRSVGAPDRKPEIWGNAANLCFMFPEMVRWKEIHVKTFVKLIFYGCEFLQIVLTKLYLYQTK